MWTYQSRACEIAGGSSVWERQKFAYAEGLLDRLNIVDSTDIVVWVAEVAAGQASSMCRQLDNVTGSGTYFSS